MPLKLLLITLTLACSWSVALAGGPVEIGAVYLIDNSDDVMGNWGNGVGARIGLSVASRPAASLHLVFEVTHHGYTGDNLFIMTPDIQGYRYEIDGEGATRFALGGMIRSYGKSAQRGVSPSYIWMQTGVSLVDRGRIEFTDWVVGQPDWHHTRLLGDSGQVDWTAYIGFGYGIPLGWGTGTRPVLELGVRATSDSDVPQFPVSVVLPLGGG